MDAITDAVTKENTKDKPTKNPECSPQIDPGKEKIGDEVVVADAVTKENAKNVESKNKDKGTRKSKCGVVEVMSPHRENMNAQFANFTAVSIVG